MSVRSDADKQFLGKFAIKHKVSIAGYPLSHYYEGKDLRLIVCGFIFGDETRRKALIKDVKKHESLIKIEVEGDFMVAVIKQPLFSQPAYDPRVIYLSPIIINKEGYHIWHLASFDKKLLVKVLDFAEKYVGGKLLKFKEEKISNISFTKVLPDLTNNQKKALEIAINKGYYDYPKKVKMEELAKMMNISSSTYQAHLKKAEGKIVPQVYKEL